MMSIESPTAARNRFKFSRYIATAASMKASARAGLSGQEHEEVVVAIEELAGFQQVAAEQADDGAIGSGAQPCGPLAEPGRALGAGRAAARGGRGGRGGPHAFLVGRRQTGQIVGIDKGK